MQSYESDLPKIEEFLMLDGKEVLEIGCGAGRLTSSLVPKAESITAIDPDPAQVAMARANVAGVDFRVGSGENLDFTDRSFDIVFFSYSLHHQNCTAALKEAMRVMRREGNILIIEPTHDGEFTRLVDIFEKDESRRLQDTYTCLSSGGYNIVRKDRYAIEYPFENESECFHYFIDKFGSGRNDGAIEKMKNILKNKMDSLPVVVADTVNIFLLEDVV